MGQFKYSEEEKKLNKIMKMDQEVSLSMLYDSGMNASRKHADEAIDETVALLHSLGKEASINRVEKEIKEKNVSQKPGSRPRVRDWDDLCKEADIFTQGQIELEDLLSEQEILAAFQELDEINREFSRQTGIINKPDLSFLAVATALQVTKNLLFPYAAEKFHYSESIDKSKRLAHDDQSIKKNQRDANDKLRDKKLKKNEPGHWINILYQTPAYDITKGSKTLGINMGGGYHRMYTLGHDPVLGWLFGTMNILTDTITLNNFVSYRVTRKPMCITNDSVPVWMLFQESYDWIQKDFLNLPAAVFAQAQHLKSDKYTKLGLPIPLLSSFNENFASSLYRNNYDYLCFARDVKITGASFVISKIIDILISLIHGLFRREDERIDLFEARTRKILLLSNSIASTSTVINAAIMSNPKKMDIGGILNTITHLFLDIRFIAKIKQEFIEQEISKRVQEQLTEVDRLYESI